MIMWKRSVPDTIPILESILRRLSYEEGDYSRFEEKLTREKSGFYGEQRLDREWLDFEMECSFRLLNGLKFENEANFTHQIDTIFICPYFIFVVESKYIAGRLDINMQTNQCIRTRPNGVVEGFTNPVDQVKRHAGFVKNFLREVGVRLPVECGVVLTNPNSIIGKVNAPDVYVFQVSGLRHKMDQLFARYREPVIDDLQMQAIGEELISRRKDGSSWRPKTDLSKLQKGVLCTHCYGGVQMHYKNGKWGCSRCGNIDGMAFYEALNDYRLLWGEWISNSEFREFFGISPEKTAYRLLKQLDLASKGNFKDRVYHIPADILKVSGNC